MRAIRIVFTAMLFAVPTLHAQVVADSTTNTLANVTTNITGDVTVGTNGSLTLLVLSNNAVLTNSVNGVIGRNSTARSNEVRLASSSARWLMGSALHVGNVGAGNRLVVSNGAVVADVDGFLGHDPGASDNVAVVTGVGSLWTNSDGLLVGYQEGGNQLVVSNGGVVADGIGYLGYFASANSNVAVVTGAGSGWSNRLTLNVGFDGAGNRLVVSNGAVVTGVDGFLGHNPGANNNVAVVTGVGSLWTNSDGLLVGYQEGRNQLVVSNGGVVANGIGYLGYFASANSNVAVVTGAGSLWTNAMELHVGYDGGGNLLVISNGAGVWSQQGYVGGEVCSNNVAIITGPGSFWNLPEVINNFLTVGGAGSGNRLEVRDGGSVRSYGATIGLASESGNNEALVTDPGSVWTNSDNFFVGFDGNRSRLVVSNAGLVATGGRFDVGQAFGVASATNHRVTVDGGTLRVANPAGNAALSVFRGTNVLNAGLIDADQLVLSRPQGFFEFNGGTLITRGAFISNGVPFVVGRSGSTPAIWDVRAGVTNTFVGGDLLIGSNAPFNQLILTDGALLTNFGRAFLGWDLGGSSNSVTLAGAGSRWWLDDGVMVGAFGPANRLVVSNGASLVTGSSSVIGLQPSASNNEAVVTGPGSSWTSGQIFVGWSGHDSRLLVSDGGLVASYAGYLGNGLAVGSNNLAVVTGAGSTWSNAFELRVGNVSAGNRLVVSNSAVVSASTNVHIGFGSTSTNNRVTVDGGTLLVTNVAGTALLDIRRGTNVLNAGLVEVDRLLVTNTLGHFEFNGGTLFARSTTVGNGLAFHVGNNVGPATFFLTGDGTHSFGAGLLVDATATLAGNGTVGGLCVVFPGGTLSPGVSIGILRFSSPPSLAGAVFMEISKNGAAVTNDQIVVTGTTTYGGSLTVSNLGPTALVAGDRFPLFSASGYAGSFSALTLPKPGPGLNFTNKLPLDGSIEVVPWNGPKIGNLTVSGTNLIFNVTDGFPGGAYDVLTATNIVTPLTNWTTLSSGTFDWLGNTTVTNGITPGELQRFFRIRVP